MYNYRTIFNGMNNFVYRFADRGLMFKGIKCAIFCHVVFIKANNAFHLRVLSL